ncbi:cytidine deaminase [Chitinophaga lutea]
MAAPFLLNQTVRMKTITHPFVFEEYNSIDELPAEDAELLFAARAATADAYAPYSRFRVAAALQLANGERLTSTNQENASYPVGICAERTGLSAASALHPGVAVRTIAISYRNELSASAQPLSPCGLCRQTILEYQQRGGAPIRLVMGGQEGKVIVVPDAAGLLPLSFLADALK